MPAGELAATRLRRRLFRSPAAGHAPRAGVRAVRRAGCAERIPRRLARRLRRVRPPDGVVQEQEPMIARLALLTLLSSCALFPLKEADCRPASWQQRGYDDGYFGNPPQDIRLVQECRRFGVQVPQDEYLSGWRDGYDEWQRLMGSVDFN